MAAARVLAAAALAVGLILLAYLDASGTWRLPMPLDRANHGWLLHFALVIAAPVSTALLVYPAGRRSAYGVVAIAGLTLASLIVIDAMDIPAACGAWPEAAIVVASGAAIYVVPALAGILAAGSPPYRPRPIVLGLTFVVGVAAILFFLFVGSTFGPICPAPRT